ncbi:hypothetical protein B9G55_04195 [Saccharibacillus sp. O16]|nr:hypothetical protein B9G55_04195 [Saccharibacillus sp. O16]
MRTVFFVDDEPLIAQGLSSIMEWERYGLCPLGHAGDGIQALERLGEQGADLVVTDIMMPRMNGLELIEALKKRYPRTRYIVLSGYEEFEYVKVGIRLGIENYILKPINIEELEATVRRTVEVWEREEASHIRQEEDRRLLRSHVLARWAEGTIERSELIQRAELLGIPTDCGAYRVDVLRLLGGETQPGAEQISKPGAQGNPGLSKGRTPQHGGEIEGGCAAPPGAQAAATVEGDAVSNEAGSAELSKERIDPARLAEICEALLSAAEPGAAVLCFADADDDLVCIRCMRTAESPCAASSGAVQPEEPLAEAARELGRLAGAAVWLAGGGETPDIVGVRACFAQAKGQFRRLLPAGEQALWVTGPDTQPGPMPASSHIWEEALLGSRAEAAGLLPRREPMNAAVRLMVEAVREAGGLAEPDYAELYAPLQRISTLEQLRQHVRDTIRRAAAGSLPEAAAAESAAHSTHVAFLLEQIRDHYAEELSLKTLSQRLNLHPNYLGQLFQQETDSNFSDALNRRRIERATSLLLHTDRRTAEIGTEVGYLDNSYFYRQFKKYTGLSPTEMRQMYGD